MTMIILRLIHIGTGVFWAGSAFFVVSYLDPAIRRSGNEGDRVLLTFLESRYLTAMPIIALLSIITGIAIFARSAAMAPTYPQSRTGITLSIGALAAVLAFVVGVAVMRRAAIRVRTMALAARVSGTPLSTEQRAEMSALRSRVATSGRAVATLLGIAVISMAIARYV